MSRSLYENSDSQKVLLYSCHKSLSIVPIPHLISANLMVTFVQFWSQRSVNRGSWSLFVCFIFACKTIFLFYLQSFVFTTIKNRVVISELIALLSHHNREVVSKKSHKTSKSSNERYSEIAQYVDVKVKWTLVELKLLNSAPTFSRK